jgi:hypothetical protein
VVEMLKYYRCYKDGNKKTTYREPKEYDLEAGYTTINSECN